MRRYDKSPICRRAEVLLSPRTRFFGGRRYGQVRRSLREIFWAFISNRRPLQEASPRDDKGRHHHRAAGRGHRFAPTAACGSQLVARLLFRVWVSWAMPGNSGRARADEMRSHPRRFERPAMAKAIAGEMRFVGSEAESDSLRRFSRPPDGRSATAGRSWSTNAASSGPVGCGVRGDHVGPRGSGIGGHDGGPKRHRQQIPSSLRSGKAVNGMSPASSRRARRAGRIVNLSFG